MSTKHPTTCPMCDRPLHPADFADDVLVCEQCGPVVYLGGRGSDLYGGVTFGNSEHAPTLDEVSLSAAPAWARLLAKVLGLHAAEEEIV